MQHCCLGLATSITVLTPHVPAHPLNTLFFHHQRPEFNLIFAPGFKVAWHPPRSTTSRMENVDASILRPWARAPYIARNYKKCHPFQDLDDTMGVTYYKSSPFDLRPLVSFQVYVTHDRQWANDAERDADMAALAEALYAALLDTTERRPIRLDIHFLGAVDPAETVEKCIAHYRAARQAHADDLQMRLVPSYARHASEHTGFLITVPTADWKERGGLGLLHFDRADENAVETELGDELLPDPYYVYPIHCEGPSQQIAPELGDEGPSCFGFGNLWTRHILDIYTQIPLLEEWDELYWKAVQKEWLIHDAEKDLEKKTAVENKSEEFDEAAALHYLKTTCRDAHLHENTFVRPFQSLNGRLGFSFYGGGIDVRPLLSIQVYITHDACDDLGDAGHLAHRVFGELFERHEGTARPKSSNMQARHAVRLDIHFLGAVPAADAACIAHYRAAKGARARDPALRLVPSYAGAATPYHGFLVTVPRDDFTYHGGLGLVYFDPAAPGAAEDVKFVYPTRALRPDMPPVERQTHHLGLSGHRTSLWAHPVKELYDGISVREEWEKRYRETYDRELDVWAREEIGRRRAEWKWALGEIARRRALKKGHEEGHADGVKSYESEVAVASYFV